MQKLQIDAILQSVSAIPTTYTAHSQIGILRVLTIKNLDLISTQRFQVIRIRIVSRIKKKLQEAFQAHPSWTVCTLSVAHCRCQRVYREDLKRGGLLGTCFLNFGRDKRNSAGVVDILYSGNWCVEEKALYLAVWYANYIFKYPGGQRGNNIDCIISPLCLFYVKLIVALLEQTIGWKRIYVCLSHRVQNLRNAIYEVLHPGGSSHLQSWSLLIHTLYRYFFSWTKLTSRVISHHRSCLPFCSSSKSPLTLATRASCRQSRKTSMTDTEMWMWAVSVKIICGSSSNTYRVRYQ